MQVFHIFPLDDVYPHQPSSGCECCPDVQGKSDSRLVIHRAYDNRPEYNPHLQEIVNELTSQSSQPQESL